MVGRHPRVWFGVGSLGLLLSMQMAGCGDGRDVRIPEAGPLAQPWFAGTGTPGASVLLVTLDTTRGDRLGCYGYNLPTTPHLDELAAEGVLFWHAISPVPITLPSHATILTGLNPNEHGIRNNGTFVLAPEFVTLTEVLAGQGYATGATLGAFPVSARFGLDQGFDHYDDDFGADRSATGWGWAERPASQVTDRTIDWLRMHRDQPFFHWAHYFDPHAPYEAPSEYRGRFSHPYDAEIAYMDAEIGRLLDAMAQMGLREHTWILVVADHGEALGEHGEPTHSIFIYDATQRVPCLLIPPAEYTDLDREAIQGRVIHEVITLRDLAPTLVNALGLGPQALPATGSSLLPLLAGEWGGPGVAYLESLAPYLEHGWSELRGVRTADWSYIRAPRPELYDLDADPHQLVNLAERKPGVLRHLEAWCAFFVESGGSDLVLQMPDAETLERLRSLGYIANPQPSGSSVNDKDPKEYTGVLARISQARAAVQTQQLDQARRHYEDALSIDPDNSAIQRELGAVHLQLGEGERALAAADAILARFPQDWDAHLLRIRGLILGQRFDEAETALMVYLDSAPYPRDGEEVYARLLAQMERVDEARAFLAQRRGKGSAPAADWATLAEVEWAAGNRERAHDVAREALAADSLQAGAWGMIGEYLAEQGIAELEAGRGEAAALLFQQSRNHLERAIGLDASEPRAAFRLGWFASRDGDARRALDLYQRSLARAPQQPEAHYNLANLLQRLNRPADALTHYDRAIAQGMDVPNLHVNRGVVLAMMGRREEAAAAWRTALSLNPDPETERGIRQNLQRLGL